MDGGDGVLGGGARAGDAAGDAGSGAGAGGGSIEDYDREAGIYDFEQAVERVSAAAEAAGQHDFPFILTARTENHLHGNADIDETMAYLSGTDKDYDYTVAWTDCLAQAASLGRSVITSGDFAVTGEVRSRDGAKPL